MACDNLYLLFFRGMSFIFFIFIYFFLDELLLLESVIYRLIQVNITINVKLFYDIKSYPVAP
jgi:hypothetical protein